MFEDHESFETDDFYDFLDKFKAIQKSTFEKDILTDAYV
jgi:hypothetical protein